MLVWEEVFVWRCLYVPKHGELSKMNYCTCYADGTSLGVEEDLESGDCEL